VSTVLSIIGQALRDTGVIGDGEPVPAALAGNAFTTLQQMLALWQIENLYVYAQTVTSFTPTAALSYTVGPGADVNMARPEGIDFASYRIDDIDYPVQVLKSFDEYERIASKTLPGAIPAVLYYNPTFPLGTLFLYGQATTGTIRLTTRVRFTSYTLTSDDLALPPEYALPVRYCLAEILSAENQTPLRPDVASLARRYRTMIKRNNLRVPQLLMPTALVGGRGSDIHTGS
jgi:hypothetical protein